MIGSDVIASERERLEKRVKISADWFYWVAGLSIVNSIVVHSGINWSFLAGLGITQTFDGFAQKSGPGGHAVALVLDVMIAGVFALIGFLARKHREAFILGIALYAADAIIFAVAGVIPGLLFHAYVIYRLVLGLMALGTLLSLAPKPDIAGTTAVDAAGPIHPT